jgi:hypothetical protein
MSMPSASEPSHPGEKIARNREVRGLYREIVVARNGVIPNDVRDLWLAARKDPSLRSG